MEVSIRKWKLTDAKDLSAALSNKHILNNLRDGIPYPYTEHDAQGYITTMLSVDENDTFAFAVLCDGKVVGSIGAFRQGNIHSRTAELGYYLAEDYWGKGIMTEAVRQLCAHLFAVTDILRICAEPFSYNSGSCRVLEKAGFQYEGTLKNNAFKNGKLLDMKLYALTREPAPFVVRLLPPEEHPEALSLIWEVFSQFEAPEYSEEGIREFRSVLENRERLRAMRFYGAYENGALVGVLSMRKPQHINFFFVRADRHRRGIGRRLFEAMKADYAMPEFTVNSAPYAVDIYRHLGFAETGPEQTINGIRFTPMVFHG